MRTFRPVTLAVTAILLCSSAANQQKPVVKTVDDLWFDAQGTAITTTGGTKREDVTVYERFLAAHKDYVPAMVAIARYYQSAADEITDRSPKSLATRTRHLETAAAHYRRAAEVAPEPIDAVMALVGLIRVLDAPNLNRMADAAPVARAAVKKYPDNAGVVSRMLQTMLPTPEAALDPATFRTVHELVPSTPGAQYALAAHLFNLERHVGKGALPRESSRKLMAEAVSAIDAALRIRPDDYEALMYKAMILEAQAERVEQDPARKKAIAAEAARLIALAGKIRKR